MNVNVDITSRGYSPDEELYIEECSGHTGDHSKRVLEVLAEQDESHECDGGMWVTIIDGEVVSEGEFHPHRVAVTED